MFVRLVLFILPTLRAPQAHGGFAPAPPPPFEKGGPKLYQFFAAMPPAPGEITA